MEREENLKNEIKEAFHGEVERSLRGLRLKVERSTNKRKTKGIRKSHRKIDSAKIPSCENGTKPQALNKLSSKETFTFIDLFAGIGGFRIAMEGLGAKCVFSSEIDRYAQEAYKTNFGETPYGDITDSRVKSHIPSGFDVLCAGFPCQPFSISGKRKGFEDTRGTLIYHVFQIIKEKQPKVVLLENVKYLLYHNKKKTLTTIISHLEKLGYKAEFKILNALDFGVPQNRERIIIVANKKKRFDFSRVEKKSRTTIKAFLDDVGDFEYLSEPFTLLEKTRLQDSGLIFAGYRNKPIRQTGVRPGTEHLSRVHKQPNRIYSSEGSHPALSSQEPSGRYWILHNRKARKLTIRECYRIMGFPDTFRLISRKAELYKQIGNSVAVPMIEAIGKELQRQFL